MRSSVTCSYKTRSVEPREEAGEGFALCGIEIICGFAHTVSSQAQLTGGFGHYDVSKTVFSSLIVISLVNVSSLIAHKMEKQTPASRLY